MDTAARSNFGRLLGLLIFDAAVGLVVGFATDNVFIGLAAAVLVHIALAMAYVFAQAARGLRQQRR